MCFSSFQCSWMKWLFFFLIWLNKGLDQTDTNRTATRQHNTIFGFLWTPLSKIMSNWLKQLGNKLVETESGPLYIQPYLLNVNSSSFIAQCHDKPLVRSSVILPPETTALGFYTFTWSCFYTGKADRRRKLCLFNTLTSEEWSLKLALILVDTASCGEKKNCI